MAWTLNRNGMIETAYKLIGLLGKNQVLDAEEVSDGTDAINLALTAMENEGLALLQISEDSVSTSSRANTLDADIDDILNVWVENSSNNHEPLMRSLNSEEYYDIADKETTGTPYEYYFEYSNPRILYLYPVPATATTIKFIKVTKIAELDDASDTVEFEKRYYQALIWKTAAILGEMKNIRDAKLNRIITMAETAFRSARGKEIRNVNRNNLRGAY